MKDVAIVTESRSIAKGGFWVIGTTAGLTESQTLKTAAAMRSIEGAVGLLVTLVLAAAFPLA